MAKSTSGKTTGSNNDVNSPISRTVIIASELGLHARPAAEFVKQAGQFDAQIEVSCKGNTVGGLSILGLMMLAASHETEVVISARGVDAPSALAVLGDLLEGQAPKAS